MERPPAIGPAWAIEAIQAIRLVGGSKRLQLVEHEDMQAHDNDSTVMRSEQQTEPGFG